MLLRGLLALLVFQLAGEVAARGFGLPIPGPVIGFVLLALLLGAWPAARREVAPAADGLLRHLSLLFVPAAVGVIQQWHLVRDQALPIGVALVVSTWAALAVTALVFRAVARRMARAEGPG
ncbi:MAG: CidA/LrgA family protein [Rhodospirillales bacterium]|nr:CidA/LrgA family protein [Rhodospirillales bacterium]